MSDRTENLIARFLKAQQILNCSSISDIVSIKFRRDTNGATYRLIRQYLQDEIGATIDPINIDTYERGWILLDHNNKTLFVEHETGLEILYIAGSVASIISLIPYISTILKRISSNNFDHYRWDPQSIEIRILNDKNQLLESRYNSLEEFLLIENAREMSKLRERVTNLENEVNRIINLNAKKKPKNDSHKNTERN